MFDRLASAVIEVERDDAKALTKEALEKGLDPLQCITEGLTKGIQKVGELFATGEFFLPELITWADSMKPAQDIFEPAMVGDQKRGVVGTFGLGTVEGDSTRLARPSWGRC